MSSNWRNRPRPIEQSMEQLSRITGDPGKSTEGETVAARLVVARKRVTPAERRGLAASRGFNKGRQGGDDKGHDQAAGPATKTVRQGEGGPIVAILGIVWARLQTGNAPGCL